VRPCGAGVLAFAFKAVIVAGKAFLATSAVCLLPSLITHLISPLPKGPTDTLFGGSLVARAPFCQMNPTLNPGKLVEYKVTLVSRGVMGGLRLI
jgi:hypothetical protein